MANQKITRGNIVYVFIDASNVWNVVKSKRKFIKYSRLKNYFKKNLLLRKLKFFTMTLIQKKGREIMI